MKTFRCRICRLVDGRMQYMTYVGPFNRIPLGWSMVKREPTHPRGMAA